MISEIEPTAIGHYHILHELGTGAMGRVYAAEHLLMGRRAAIKVLHPQLAVNEAIVDRFVNEARAINAIGHPNVVEVTDAGTWSGRPYLIMELLDGETIEQRLLREGKLDEGVAVHIVLQVSAALSAAHAKGIVHRDIKPDNLFLVSDGSHPDFVKVLDFGIAKLDRGRELPGKPSDTARNTILGTPSYMSPEQCLCEESLDHRSDIYSLGVVLYRMVTGELPFAVTGGNVMRYILAHVNEAPTPPRAHVPGLSPRIERAILRALEKRPEQRFADVMAFAAAIAQERTIAQAVALEARTSAQLAAPELLDQISPKGGAAPVLAGRLARILVEGIHTGKLKPPSMPATALRCLEILRRPNHSTAQLASVLSGDPIVAPQVLRYANSAFNSRGEPVRTLVQAISRLGDGPLQTLLVELSARRLFESRNAAIRRAFRSLWDHSVAVGVVARNLSHKCKGADPELVYLAGLLHDVGKPVAGAVLLEAEHMAKRVPWHASDSWLEIVEQCQREVGFALARTWQLPDEVLFAIARCDHYSLDGDASPVNLVCLANALVKREGIYPQAVDAAELEPLIEEGKRLFSLDDATLVEVTESLRDTNLFNTTVIGETA